MSGNEIDAWLKKVYAKKIREGLLYEQSFAYTDESGQPLYYKGRFKNPTTKEKFCPFVHINGNGITTGKPKFPSGDPLFNLPLLKDAHEVWFFEGELKTVLAMKALGIVGTTTGGFDTVTKSVDFSYLKGKGVIAWPDVGADSKKYVERLADLLPDSEVWEVELDKLGLSNKEDVADWIRKNPGKTTADIPIVPVKKNLSAKEGLSKINSKDLLEATFPPRPRYMPWLLKQSINMIHAWRGTGKTHVAFGIAYALATGGQFLKWKASQAVKVLYIDGELSVTEVQERLRDIVMSNPSRAIPELLDWVTPDLQGEAMPDLASPEGQKKMDKIIEESGSDVIVIDNISCLVRGDGIENDSQSWVSAQEWGLKHKRAGRTLIFIHHSGKGGTQRGTSKREDIMDVVIGLKPLKVTDDHSGAAFELRFEKKRNMHGPDAEPFTAKLISEFGPQRWEIQSIKESIREQVCKLDDQGFSQKEIVQELQISKGLVSRYLKEKKNLASEQNRTEDDETEF